MATQRIKKNKTIQRHMDRWADLMRRIVKNPEIADRIPNHANLFFGEGDLIFVNGKPKHYSELVRINKRQKKVSATKTTAKRNKRPPSTSASSSTSA